MFGSGSVAAVVVFSCFQQAFMKTQLPGFEIQKVQQLVLNCCMELQLSTFSY